MTWEISIIELQKYHGVWSSNFCDISIRKENSSRGDLELEKKIQVEEILWDDFMKWFNHTFSYFANA